MNSSSLGARPDGFLCRHILSSQCALHKHHNLYNPGIRQEDWQNLFGKIDYYYFLTIWKNRFSSPNKQKLISVLKVFDFHYAGEVTHPNAGERIGVRRERGVGGGVAPLLRAPVGRQDLRPRAHTGLLRCDLTGHVITADHRNVFGRDPPKTSIDDEGPACTRAQQPPVCLTNGGTTRSTCRRRAPHVRYRRASITVVYRKSERTAGKRNRHQSCGCANLDQSRAPGWKRHPRVPNLC